MNVPSGYPRISSIALRTASGEKSSHDSGTRYASGCLGNNVRNIPSARPARCQVKSAPRASGSLGLRRFAVG